jgi:hypothetical protein
VILGQWHRVALVYDGTQAALHVDGWQAASAPLHGALAMLPHLDLIVGTWHKTNQALFGAVDEIAVYDRALQPNELGAGRAAPPR